MFKAWIALGMVALGIFAAFSVFMMKADHEITADREDIRQFEAQQAREAERSRAADEERRKVEEQRAKVEERERKEAFHKDAQSVLDLLDKSRAERPRTPQKKITTRVPGLTYGDIELSEDSLGLVDYTYTLINETGKDARVVLDFQLLDQRGSNLGTSSGIVVIPNGYLQRLSTTFPVQRFKDAGSVNVSVVSCDLTWRIEPGDIKGFPLPK